MLAVRIVGDEEGNGSLPDFCSGCGLKATELVVGHVDHLVFCEKCFLEYVNHVGPIYVKLRELPENAPVLVPPVTVANPN